MNLTLKTTEQLQKLHAEITNTLNQKYMSDVPDPIIIIKGQEYAKRALTVAAAGHHSILFCGPRGSSKDMLCIAAAKLGVTAYKMLCCPCGGFNHPTMACICKPKDIEKHILTNSPFFEAVEIFCNLSPVPARDLESKYVGTSLTDIVTRNKNVILGNFELDENSQALLKQAVASLPLTPGIITKFKHVACTIAAMDGDKVIKPQHLSEAIQYRPWIRQF